MYLLLGIFLYLGSGLNMFQTNTRKNLEIFWSEFQNCLAENDIQRIKYLISFPLKDAQTFVGRYTEDGLKSDEFEIAYERIFNKEVIEIIKNSTYLDLEKEPDGVNSFKDAWKFRISLEENTEEEAQIIIWIAKKDKEFKIVGLAYFG